ncbi:MAG: ArdC family protein, partial [Dehalococcoidales bacterium]|nr:ArdC family protein [Dehalococcoidales bacterium]
GLEQFLEWLSSSEGLAEVKKWLKLEAYKRGIAGPSHLKETFIKVGGRVRYIGKGNYRYDTWPKDAWLKAGVTGVVVEYREGSCIIAPEVVIGGETFPKVEPWAVVRWDFGGQTAIDAESEGRTWERLTTSQLRVPSGTLSLPTGEKCEVVSPQYYHLMDWFNIPLPDYSFAIEPEAKERKIDEVLKKLQEGVAHIHESGAFRDFLLTMSKFHQYSFGNQILIAIQRRDATRVAGFNTWKDVSRWVKKGETGIAILAPCMSGERLKCPICETKDLFTEGSLRKHLSEFHQRVDVSDLIRLTREEAKTAPLYFKVVYVFDVSQTEGKPLPELKVPVLTGEANEDLFVRLLGLAKIKGLEVSFKSRPDQDPDIKGSYLPKSIWVRPEESRAQQLKTFLHEVGHYFSEGVFGLPRRVAETIAESAAFAVGAHFGFDTGTRSFPYVALWAKEEKVLKENLESIRKVTKTMIDSLEHIGVS